MMTTMFSGKLTAKSPAKSIGRHSQKLRIALLALSMAAAMPAVSHAEEQTIPDHDARLDGYAGNAVLDAGGTGGTYIFLFLLGIVGLGCVFISGKRSHLD